MSTNTVGYQQKVIANTIWGNKHAGMGLHAQIQECFHRVVAFAKGMSSTSSLTYATGEGSNLPFSVMLILYLKLTVK